MSDKPSRTWLRFHLLTAVLITIAAGTALGLNCVPRLEKRINGNIGAVDYDHVGTADVVGIHREYGFPFAAAAHERYFIQEAYFSGIGGWSVASAANVVADIAIWLAVLCGVATASEFIIRRRGLKSPD